MSHLFFRAAWGGLTASVLALVSLAVQAQDPAYQCADDSCSGSCAPSCPDSECGIAPSCRPCRCGKFFVGAEALWLQLDHGTRRPAPVVVGSANQQTLLTTYDGNYNTAAGPRLTFGWYLNNCSTIEATYFGLQHWNSSAQVLGDSNLSLPPQLGIRGGFSRASEVTTDATANLNSAEFNYFRQIGCSGFSLLNGFRYLNFGEHYNIEAVGLVDGEDHLAPQQLPGSTSVYNINAQNNLYGWQTGARYQTFVGRFGMSVTGKAGIYGNSYSAHSLITDAIISQNNRDLLIRGTHLAFIGEAGLNGTYQITQGLYFKAGYNVMWIDGIARAASQLDFCAPLPCETTAAFGRGAFLHGANIGFDYFW